MEVEAEQLAAVGVVAEDGADGVVGADVLEVDAAVEDVAAVNFGAVADRGDVAFCVGEDGEELGFERGAGLAEKLGGKLKDAAGVGDDLHGFDAGDLVEEPAAGGVHQLGVALHFEQLEDGDPFVRRKHVGGVGG